MRKNISTNTPSEIKVGYSRAVKIDNKIYFSGTTAVDENGQTQGINTYEQTKFIFEKIKKVLKQEEFFFK